MGISSIRLGPGRVKALDFPLYLVNFQLPGYKDRNVNLYISPHSFLESIRSTSKLFRLQVDIRSLCKILRTFPIILVCTFNPSPKKKEF